MSSPLTIRLITADDVPVGMRLKEQAGWNQTAADWHRFLAMQPDGCFLAELDGVPVGTTAACIFDDVAWIAMVLVDASLRGKGVGRALMEHALAFCDHLGVRSIRLDATPMGQPLYEKLGFVAEYTLSRYGGVLPPGEPKLSSNVAPAQPAHLPQLVSFDRTYTRTNRAKFIECLFADCANLFRIVEQDGKIVGYTAGRPGTKALQLGPCLATADAGPVLFADACQRHGGQSVFIDIPVNNLPAMRLAEHLGLVVQRPLFRMGRGPLIEEDRAAIWASSGPELG